MAHHHVADFFGAEIKKTKNLGAVSILLTIGFIIANFFVLPEPLQAQQDDNVSEIKQEIEKKQQEIDILQKEISAYQSQIKAKQGEAKGLQNQIAILDNELARLSLDIEATGKRIEQTNLEVQSLNLQIQELEQDLEKQKKRIGEYLRLIYQADQISSLEILLLNNSFSEFYDQIKYTEDIHADLKQNVDALKVTKQDMETQRGNLEQKLVVEKELKNTLQEQRDALEEKTIAQELLLVQNKLTERQYKSYAYQLQLEQQQANADISDLQQNIAKILEDREKAERFEDFGPAQLAWPVSPLRGISAFFHDPGYPFRYLFEHPAIDIRAAQGTSIRAPEDGFVARVKFNGNTSYGYVMLIHNNELSTVFGHISQPLVQEEEFVSQGQIIALSGGTPKTHGAGNLSTGAHLHFEVRLNGIPVNPLEYLPPF